MLLSLFLLCMQVSMSESESVSWVRKEILWFSAFIDLKKYNYVVSLPIATFFTVLVTSFHTFQKGVSKFLILFSNFYSRPLTLNLFAFQGHYNASKVKVCSKSLKSNLKFETPFWNMWNEVTKTVKKVAIGRLAA